jgi:hypothetical protein
LPTYARADLAFERGEGAWLWTVDGRRFLDFGSGIATASLGHGHPHLSKAIAEQAAKVMHVSNLYRIPGAERLAQRLVDATFADSVFFCNSGAEANEAALKLARRYQVTTRGLAARIEVISFENSFHGRTIGALAVTGQAKYREGFGPLFGPVRFLPFGDVEAVRANVTDRTAAVIIEPVQAEGGIHLPPPGFPDFRIGRPDGGRDHHDIRVTHVRGVVALRHADPDRLQPIGDRQCPCVDIDAADDPAAKLKEIEDRLNKLRSPFRSAEKFWVEEVIDPRKTRSLLCEFARLAEPIRTTGPATNMAIRP